MMTVKKMNYTKSLSDLLVGQISNIEDVINRTINVSGIAIDSRLVSKGDMFMAYRGSTVNGVDYIDDAIDAGAIAILVDDGEAYQQDSVSVPVISVANLRKQAGHIISRFYEEPSKKMRLVGVTGTNGKTTVTFMIAYAMYSLGKQSALIGTIGKGLFRRLESDKTTTPDPVKLHSLLASWVNKIDTAVMEVSSHALDQGRVAGVEFDTAIFTNLSRDHLDYHESFEEYADAKFQLFNFPGLKNAIINIDDDYGILFIEKLPDDLNVIAYSTESKILKTNKKNVQFVYCDNINVEGLITTLNVKSPWGKITIQTSLLGSFNIANCLAAFSGLCLSGLEAEKAANALSTFNGVPGRMEYFSTPNKPLVVVDYAHTPDAMEKALQALKPYCIGKLHCIFGCGGDRDTGKRSKMGEIAELLSDYVVITNDNPRTESEERIVENILEGIKNKSSVAVIYDRSHAITSTFLNADVDDIILIAGKGHETTQQIGTTFYPFSDRELARRLTEGEI